MKIERQTLHVSDDAGRIAMLETRTVGTDPSPAELTRYIYSNHLQSASLELDEEGEIISYEEYHPYGTTSYQAMNASINAVAKRYRYTGKERDEESGLYYHGARYYIPWLARWSAVDPINSENYNLQKGYGLEKNRNRQFLDFCASSYEYCYANPIRFIDPNGEQVNPLQEAEKEWNGMVNSVRKTYNKATEAVNDVVAQPFTRMAGKSAIFKINSELQDKNVAVNSFQVPKVIGNTTTKKTNEKRTDTDYTSATKYNLYVNTNSTFTIDESNANKFANYELGVVAALMNNFVTGLGSENYSFPENGIISNKFIENKSMILKDALTKFLKTPTQNITNEQFTFGGEGLKQDFNQTGTIFSITGLVGSGTITIKNDEARKGVTISIFNITSLTSGALGKEVDVTESV